MNTDAGPQSNQFRSLISTSLADLRKRHFAANRPDASQPGAPGMPEVGIPTSPNEPQHQPQPNRTSPEQPERKEYPVHPNIPSQPVHEPPAREPVEPSHTPVEGP